MRDLTVHASAGVLAELTEEIMGALAHVCAVHDHDVATLLGDAEGSNRDGDHRLIGLGVGVGDDHVLVPKTRHLIETLGGGDGGVVLFDHVAGVEIDDLEPGVVEAVDLEELADHAAHLLHFIAHADNPDVAHIGDGVDLALADIVYGCLVVVGDGLNGGHAGEEDLRAAAEAVEGVRGDGTDADAQVAAHHLGIAPDLRSLGGGADERVVLIAVVVVDREALADVLAELVDKVDAVVGAVGAERADEADVLVLHTRAAELLHHDLRHGAHRRAAGDIVEDDADFLGVLRQLVDRLGAVGVVDLFAQLLFGQLRLLVAGDPVVFDVPIVGKLDLHGLKALPGILG